MEQYQKTEDNKLKIIFPPEEKEYTIEEIDQKLAHIVSEQNRLSMEYDLWFHRKNNATMLGVPAEILQDKIINDE